QVAQIGALVGSIAPGTALPAAAAAKHITENIAEGFKDIADVSESRTTSAATTEASHAGMTEAIITGALIRIAQDLIRCRGLLESLLRRLIARIAIRMILKSQLAISFLNRVLIGPTGNAEDLVEIFIHGFWFRLSNQMKYEAYTARVNRDI